MKLFILILAILSAQLLSAQTGNKPYRQQADSIINSKGNVEAKEKAKAELSELLQRKLDISKEKANGVLIACERAGDEMQAVARNKNITREQKTIQLKSISDARDRKLIELLTSGKLDRALLIIAGKEK